MNRLCFLVPDLLLISATQFILFTESSYITVNFKALSASIILSFALSTLASPVAGESFVTHPLVRKTSSSIATIIAKDQAHLARYNSQASSSATVTNEVDSYIATVQVGSQTFALIVDTGSSNTWIGAGTKFTKGSATSTGDSSSVSYGSGSFSGKEYLDAVTLGSATVSSQSIGVASSSSGFTGVDAFGRL